MLSGRLDVKTQHRQPFERWRDPAVAERAASNAASSSSSPAGSKAGSPARQRSTAANPAPASPSQPGTPGAAEAARPPRRAPALRIPAGPSGEASPSAGPSSPAVATPGGAVRMPDDAELLALFKSIDVDNSGEWVCRGWWGCAALDASMPHSGH